MAASTPTTNPQRWMDNDIHLVIPQSRTDASKQFSGVLKNARYTLSEEEKSKLKNTCDTGLTDKFDLLTYCELDDMEKLSIYLFGNDEDQRFPVGYDDDQHAWSVHNTRNNGKRSDLRICPSSEITYNRSILQ